MECLLNHDGELYLTAKFIARSEAELLYQQLRSDLQWRQEEILVYGRPVRVPRLVAWYGDPDAVYTYSGVAHAPLPWLTPLLEVKQRIEEAVPHCFNSVLANFYRDGNDSVGWHADKEHELGRNPFIASVSLGEERAFRIRHNKTGQTLDFVLPHGSLLCMGGAFQSHWRHCLPKTRKVKQGRINLTYRRVFPTV